VPWAIFLGLRASLLYYFAGGIFLSIGYSCYIYRAAPPFYCVEPLMSSLAPVCWASIFVLLILYLRRLRPRLPTGSANAPDPRPTAAVDL
jgi:hypothetical protein